jgi:hypothetical protein
MTRQELMKSIKHLPWERDLSGALRCANGDCPILAAYHLKFGYNDGKDYENDDYGDAGYDLGLHVDDIDEIVSEADDFDGLIPELEGA